MEQEQQPERPHYARAFSVLFTFALRYRGDSGCSWCRSAATLPRASGGMGNSGAGNRDLSSCPKRYGSEKARPKARLLGPIVAARTEG